MMPHLWRYKGNKIDLSGANPKGERRRGGEVTFCKLKMAEDLTKCQYSAIVGFKVF